MTHSNSHSRRSKWIPLLSGLAVFVLLNLAAVSVRSAPAPVRIKLATLAPKGSSIDKSLSIMGQKWKAGSGGAVELVVYPGGTVGGESKTVSLMRNNLLQAAMLTAQGLSEIDRSITSLQDIPMVYRSLDEVTYVRQQMRASIEREFRRHGFVLLFIGDTGWVRFFSKADAARPADFKPMKMFTWAGSSAQAEIMKSAGFNPVVLETADIYLSLQNGAINAVPSIPLAVLPGQYYKVCSHMLELNWAPLVGGLVVRADVWDAFPEATRAELQRAASEAEAQVTADARRENNESVMTMKGLGLKVRPVTPELDAEWRAFAEGLYPRIKGAMVPEDRFNEVQSLLASFRNSGGARK